MQSGSDRRGPRFHSAIYRTEYLLLMAGGADPAERGRDMPGSHDADFSEDQGLALIHYCPKCEDRKVMSLETIRPAMFGKRAIIGYRCDTCATRRVDVVAPHALGDAAERVVHRLSDRHDLAKAL
uniref:Uncharacterized protein n=1 Tax=Rhodopseudomonas palustris (strain BisA53) TaxID=316055 RepID=Q07MR3_RHOP5